MKYGPILSLAAALLSPVGALACKSDTECNLNDKCLFAKGVDEGVCMHVVPPVTVPTEQQQRDPSWREKGETGYPCQFNTDCLPGKACYKDEFKRHGYCMKR